MVGFIRFGNDFTQNFYQIEIPLKVTLPSSATGSNCASLSPETVWPAENEIDLSLALLTAMKIGVPKTPLPDGEIYYPDDHLDVFPDGDGDAKLRLGIRGNPNFGLVRNLMLGVKSDETHQDIKGEVWFNELRVADMDNSGGMAAVLNVDSNLADFATVSATGRSGERRVAEECRSRGKPNHQ